MLNVGNLKCVSFFLFILFHAMHVNYSLHFLGNLIYDFYVKTIRDYNQII